VPWRFLSTKRSNDRSDPNQETLYLVIQNTIYRKFFGHKPRLIRWITLQNLRFTCRGTISAMVSSCLCFFSYYKCHGTHNKGLYLEVLFFYLWLFLLISFFRRWSVLFNSRLSFDLLSSELIVSPDTYAIHCLPESKGYTKGLVHLLRSHRRRTISDYWGQYRLVD
jgi:hypothetical protein